MKYQVVKEEIVGTLPFDPARPIRSLTNAELAEAFGVPLEIWQHMLSCGEKSGTVFEFIEGPRGLLARKLEPVEA